MKEEKIKKRKIEDEKELSQEEVAKKIIESIVGKEVEKKSEAELERERLTSEERRRIDDELGRWQPKTKLGKLVKEGKMKDIDEILVKYKVLEPEIVDSLIKIRSDLLAIGQAKGKFGGGKRRVWRQTQKKTKEGNVPTFACLSIVGDEAGHVGAGYGKAKETLPAKTKAIRDAKLKVFKIERGCGSFDCSCSEPHSLPFKVEGKCGSVRIILMPAPQGTGLAVGDEVNKILKLAGVRDIYGKTFGQTRSTINLAKACILALKKTNDTGEI